MAKPIPQEYIWKTIPEILYEAPPGPNYPANPIPYIDVPQDKAMPALLYIFEYKRTGEFEIGERGKRLEIVDQIPHQYFDLQFLLGRVDLSLADTIRSELGLKPLSEAKKAGESVLDKVQAKEQDLRDVLEKTQPERILELKTVQKAQEKRDKKKESRKVTK